MGNGCVKLGSCLSHVGHLPSRRRRRHVFCAVMSDPYDENFGHSFCYVRPNAAGGASAAALVSSDFEETTTFRSISGAALSANSSTPLSTSLLLADLPAAGFESTDSFSSVPLQPVPRFSSGPIAGGCDRGFMSGPIERGIMSGPLDHRAPLFSAPLEKPPPTSSYSAQLRRSLSHGLPRPRRAPAAASSLVRDITKSISGRRRSKDTNFSIHQNDDDGGGRLPESVETGLQWAQGKAGEDRVHVVVSEEHDWVFIGIYDGFNGPDATDFLLSNLYSAVNLELKGLLWEEQPKDNNFLDSLNVLAAAPAAPANNWASSIQCCREGRPSYDKKNKVRIGHDRRLKEQNFSQQSFGDSSSVRHARVLKALYRALRTTEDTFLEISDTMVSENPELALMGSCVLVMLMKGEDVYVMNVGDSRAILAQKVEQKQDLGKINEDVTFKRSLLDDPMNDHSSLAAVQLTFDHTTSVVEEVRRIKNEHPDDSSVIVNGRVKGSLKVTRAFGSGFLKQRKWNDALLEMFRIDYIGSSPYINCNPSLYHHKLASKDRFLILSSDGLYQYFTNQEAVYKVEIFMAKTSEGDPAQHLVEEMLFRAARKAGMEFHELLEIPHGDRRRYHDDISIIVISLEGQIWRSCL